MDVGADLGHRASTSAKELKPKSVSETTSWTPEAGWKSVMVSEPRRARTRKLSLPAPPVRTSFPEPAGDGVLRHCR